MFEGFEASLSESIFIRRKGVGPPLLLLHGFPENHLMWHRVAPVLSEHFTVICADLPGYGSSAETAPNKSAMALAMMRMMRAQGFSRFSIAGHDRGARLAYRLALDHADNVERLVLLDIVPTAEVFERADMRFALAFWPWSLLAQPEPLPERLIAADPEAIVDDALSAWGSDRAAFPAEIRRAYVDALRDRAHSICEEFRAAATLDLARDRADRKANRRIACPVLVLWSADSALDTWYGDEGGPLGIWRAWADDVRGHAVAGGHFFPEANASVTAEALRSFFLQRR
ncbi:MAG TPA: alpha/beta hydrolase [Thermoanaerobaculia bacterium]